MHLVDRISDQLNEKQVKFSNAQSHIYHTVAGDAAAWHELEFNRANVLGIISLDMHLQYAP